MVIKFAQQAHLLNYCPWSTPKDVGYVIVICRRTLTNLNIGWLDKLDVWVMVIRFVQQVQSLKRSLLITSPLLPPLIRSKCQNITLKKTFLKRKPWVTFGNIIVTRASAFDKSLRFQLCAVHTKWSGRFPSWS